MLNFLSDVMISAAALGAGVYCFVLARRVQALRTLDQGMGGAIAVLSGQVDDLTRALAQAQDSARDNADRLATQTQRADAASRRIELMLAALHDLPRADPSPAPMAQPVAAPPPASSFSRPGASSDTPFAAAPPDRGPGEPARPRHTDAETTHAAEAAPWMRSWGRAGLSPAPRMPPDPLPRAAAPDTPAPAAGRARILHRHRSETG
jgi:hypothetical protein